MNENTFLDKFYTDRNIKENTRKGYDSAIRKYIEFHDEKLDLLIFEAQSDEKKNILLKNRNIKNRLLSFRNYLFTTELSNNTIKTYLSRIKTFYKHYEIEIPELPPAKYNIEYETSYLDIPSKEDIKKVLESSPLKLKALILFMSSSGTAKAETLSLSIKDFLLSVSEYNEYDGDLYSTLNQLKHKKNIIPTFYIKRQKTDKYYYTFCSSEATEVIIEYLLSRELLKESDKLFPFSDSYVINTFQKINDEMNWGFRGRYRYFRSHSLRKFHASNIGLSAEYIDMLQGRSKSPIHETYIKTNPKELKKIYKKVMNNVSIYPPLNSHNDFNKENINITINIFISDSQYNLI